MITLKEALDTVYGETGFLPVGEYAHSTTADDRQLFYLANRVARDLTKEDWTQLRRTWDITMGTENRYALPPDWRDYLPDTGWSKSEQIPMDLPTEPRYRSYLEARKYPTGIRYRAWFENNELHIHNPNPGKELRLAYVSNWPIEDKLGSPKERFTEDDDVWRMDADLLIKGVKALFKAEKGVDGYEQDYASYVRYLNLMRGTDEGGKSINMTTDKVGSFVNPPFHDLWGDH